MEYRRFDHTYMIRMDRGEEIITSLTEFCERERISLGSVEAIGAADHAVIGLYDAEERQYHQKVLDGPMEIVSLKGNISEKDGCVYLHLHIALCDEQLKLIGGHLNECRISATCEMQVQVLDGKVERHHDNEVTGLNLYRFL